MARNEAARLSALCLATYPEWGPSSRYRICQYIPRLAEVGIDVTCAPFLDNALFSRFVTAGSRTPKAIGIAAAGLKRLAQLLRVRRFDVLVVQRESMPWGPPWFEYVATRASRCPLVYDVDDAVYLPPEEVIHLRSLTRLGRAASNPRRARWLAKTARETVVAGPTLADWAHGLSARVTLIPTVLDGETFRPRQRSNLLPVIGWIGTPSAAGQLEIVLPALARLAERQRYVLRLVGAGRRFELPGVQVENVAWRLETEAHEVAGFDVGLCPLHDDAWSRAKPGFKASLYMACGVPSVCSPVGDVVGLVAPAGSGLLAASPDEWLSALTRLVGDPMLRESMGRRARQAFERGPTLLSEAPRLAAVLRRAAGR